MKKYISIIFIAILLMVTVSCGENSAKKQPTSAATTSTETSAESSSTEKNTDKTENTSKTRPTSAASASTAASEETVASTAPNKSEPKSKDTEKIDYSYKSKYAKIRCPEVPYYGFIEPLETLMYKKYDRAVKHNDTTKYKGDIGYRDYKNGVEIVLAPDSGKIPEKIDGKPVIRLGGYLDCSPESESVDTYFTSFDDGEGIGNVEKITIPSGVKEIVFDTFESLRDLEKINVSPNNPYYSSVDGILYNKEKTVLLFIPLNHSGNTINIPKTVNTAYSLFSNNTVTVNVPASVNKLSSALNVRGEYTNSVYNLEELSIDSCLEEVNVDDANKSFSSLNGVLYNKSKTRLFVYPRNRSEKVLKIPDSVKTIDCIYLDFYDNLKEIDFGKKIKKIGFCSEPAMAGYDNKLTVKGYKNSPVRKWIKSLGCWDDNVKFIALD
ncbi:MAG: hypothetical protein K6F88_08810 [Ruminococcus sp.]|nr:hypothetical protein [Ruminococcus sp.]